jgi:hypothetical protein
MSDSDCDNKLDSVLEISKHFVETNDTSSLERSISFLNEASICEKTRKSAIEQKIGTLIIMRKYDQAIKFVESLLTQDMEYPFQKEVVLKNLYALKAETLTDSKSRKKYYSEGILYLENYIRRLNPDSVEFFAAYHDLFFLKEKILDTVTFNNSIDSLIRATPRMKKYFGSHKLY